MAKKIVDISTFLNNDAPEIVLFGKTYTVKNDKTTILLLNEMQRKMADNKLKIKDGETGDDMILRLLIGETAGNEVIEILNGMTNYNENARVVMFNVMALATGQTYEELEKRFQREQSKI